MFLNSLFVEEVYLLSFCGGGECFYTLCFWRVFLHLLFVEEESVSSLLFVEQENVSTAFFVEEGSVFSALLFVEEGSVSTHIVCGGGECFYTRCLWSRG